MPDSPTEYQVDTPPRAAGERIDRALAAALPFLSRSRIKSLLEAGFVEGGGVPVRDASHKVRAGDRYTVRVPPARPAEPRPQPMALSILYEDDQLLVIDKPAGLVVHPAPGSRDSTLVNALLAHCGDSLSGIGGVCRPGIVHRLDKDTSGLLVVAKTDAAHAGLAQQFLNHTVDRAYLALVWGVPVPPAGRIAGNIGRSPHDRKKMALRRSGGKAAATRYRTLRSYGKVVSLVECRLDTGRTHQIRVHMTSRGHPLVGDRTYGRPRPGAGPLYDALLAFPRQALHAAELGFDHPTLAKRLEFRSPLPPDLDDLIAILEHVEPAA